MGPRRLLLLGMIPVLVLGLLAAVGFGGYRVLVSLQRKDAAAGHVAYLGGDCATALSRYQRAQVSWLDGAVATRVGPEVGACRQWVSVQQLATRSTSPAAAVGYVRYVNGYPQPQFAALAKRAIRAELTSTPPSALAETGLCPWQDELVRFKVLRMSSSDPIAVPFLTACGRWWAKSGDQDGEFGDYAHVQAISPDSVEARSTLAELGRLTFTRAVRRSRQPPLTLRNFTAEPDPALHGLTGIVIDNDSRSPLTITVAGAHTRIATAPACKACRLVKDAADSPCPGPGAAMLTVRLPTGRYGAVVTLDGLIDQYTDYGTLNLKPNWAYHICYASLD